MATYILIGPMGVGKSTVGAELAHRLGETFIDTDALIEERTGRTIADIFVEDGEAAFREIESTVVLESLNTPGVLSLGGGACVSEPALTEIAQSSAHVIFLDISLSEVSKRVGFDQARPLLAINPRSRWQELMSARRPIYEKLADQTIVVDGKGVKEIVDEIVMAS